MGDDLIAGAEEVPEEVIRSINWAIVSEYSATVLDNLMSSADMDAFVAAYDAQLAAMQDPETTDENIIIFNSVKGENLSSREMNTITYAIAFGYQDAISQN